MSPYTILSCKIDTCCCKKVALKSAKTVGKDSSCKSKGLHCVYRQKDNCKWTESVWIAFFEERVPAVHSNGFPHFADLPVSLSLYCLYSIRARLHNSVWYSAGPLWHVGAIIWVQLERNWPMRTKSALTQIQYLREVPVFHSAGHIYH